MCYAPRTVVSKTKPEQIRQTMRRCCTQPQRNVSEIALVILVLESIILAVLSSNPLTSNYLCNNCTGIGTDHVQNILNIPQYSAAPRTV